MCSPEIVIDRRGGNRLTRSSANDTSPEANKTVIEHFWQIFNETKVDDNGELDKASELETIIDPDCVLRHAVMLPSEEVRGHDGIKAFVSTIRAAFPDFKVTIDEEPFHQWAAEGDRVVTIWQVSGKPVSNEVKIFPPLDEHLWETYILESTEPVEVYGVSISRISDGKIAEIWMNTSALRLNAAKGKKWFAFLMGGW
jgi:hypothetical protein